MRKTRFAYFLHFRGSHQVLTQAWTLTLARENKKAPSPTKGTKHIPRYHPDSCIYQIFFLLFIKLFFRLIALAAEHFPHGCLGHSELFFKISVDLCSIQQQIHTDIQPQHHHDQRSQASIHIAEAWKHVKINRKETGTTLLQSEELPAPDF